MATAIRQVELSAPWPAFEGLDSYRRCMLVLRWQGRIVGRSFVPLNRGRLAPEEVARHGREALGPDALHAWTESALGFDERDPPGTRRPTATVAICTRERPDDLVRTLAGVVALEPRPEEILVVDNAPSTARTREVVAGVPGVRYVVEPARGLNNARNRAMREASGDVIAFTDDDAVPEPEWLDGLLQNFGDPRVLCVTGLTLPSELETPAQELFEEHCPFARGFRRRVFNGRIDNPLAVSRVGAGANMALRRRAIDLVGPFDGRLDAGTATRSGGDHEMFTRILLAGYRIIYEPRAVSWHRHRRTQEELVDVVRGYGTGVYAMWSGLLIERREFGVLRLAWQWFRYDHLPILRRPSRLRAGEGRDALRRAELRGCVAGPRAWLASRRSTTTHA
jgi:cellulose synthase/poly-beta-1,6-N-acetylglucosamine synthase-like glycosyltransferase